MSALAWLLVAHVALLAAMLAAVLTHVVSFGGPLWVVAVVVPVAGPASALALVAAERSKGAGQRAGELAELRASEVSDEVIDGTEGTATAVPLEDAMLINDAATRRGLVLDVLLDGGQGMGASLARARSSSDPEVAHYASSASMEFESAFEEALSTAASRYQESPDDLEVVRAYVGILERYLSSGLAEGEVRRIQEQRYREVLAKKVELDPEEVDLVRLASSQLDAGLNNEADATIAQLERDYPASDDSWTLRMRYWYELRRPAEMRKMVAARSGGHASPRLRAELDFWERVMA